MRAVAGRISTTSAVLSANPTWPSMVSATSWSESSRTWINERLTYTHGYGLTLGPVNRVTSEGLPELLVRNLPTETIPALPVDQPGLYFGELSNDYVIVRSATQEFDFPRGNGDAFTSYAGSGGLALESLWRRVLFAIRFGAYQIAFNDGITGESRILFHRNIAERVNEIAPFLTFDRDPYLVLADGRLYWMYDAYTTSGRYPYATPAAGINYIRNSVKIVIDAYNGTTTFYAADATDPLLSTYANVFPGMFKPLGEMPAALRAHIRYPEDIFALQESVFATYLMTEPAVYYNREYQREVPTIDEGGVPGVHFPFRPITGTNIVWDDDSSSANYNRWIDINTASAGVSPEPMYKTPSYDYGAVIAYNTARTPGLGSAIFLHVSHGSSTAGCVALPTDQLLALLRWLDPGRAPVIAIGTQSSLTTS